MERYLVKNRKSFSFTFIHRYRYMEGFSVTCTSSAQEVTSTNDLLRSQFYPSSGLFNGRPDLRLYRSIDKGSLWVSNVFHPADINIFVYSVCVCVCVTKIRLLRQEKTGDLPCTQDFICHNTAELPC
jgi:hypothetical protein